ncbi:F-box protein SKIP23 [Bienertia sinuspersici]
MDNQAENVRDWSSLPSNTLSLVLKRLNDTETDRRRLRSVCTSWRSSLCPLNPPLHFPLELILPSSSSNCNTETALLQQSVFYLIAPPLQTSINSSCVWLTRVKESSSSFGCPNFWTLQNPISSADVFQPLPELQAEINFLDYRISEVARSYSFYYFSDAPKPVKTVILPKSGATADCFSILSLFINGDLRLLKSGAEEWVNISAEGFASFADIIAFEVVI